MELLEKEARLRGREYKVKRIQRTFRLYLQNKRAQEALLHSKATIVHNRIFFSDANDRYKDATESIELQKKIENTSWKRLLSFCRHCCAHF
jgi:hypothetical protein